MHVTSSIYMFSGVVCALDSSWMYDVTIVCGCNDVETREDIVGIP